ncbi:pyridoxal phosphate-dependent aminotransferase [Vibrio viridaestus]|uniref:Aminotransferase n=1 Tax=Vibrio viridaestus TaxID=2487322 RepID=A0A3N9U4L5_9VIBR|nr:aminotransferase class I/II-fold pyridoxal phosphate-dependent enzyme [Vibrio viridaestus]RQW64562.1 aminotransferase class I/II-fold pyridoxal phosphate-dependent enzyme [Vibrio viridaestus]
MMKSGQHGGNTRQVAQILGKKEEDIVDFSANINPLGLSNIVKNALITKIDESERYPDIDYFDLYTAISHHINVTLEHIAVGNGATELIYEWVAAQAPSKALLIEPSFGEYRRALEQIDCEIVTHILLEENDFQLTQDVLQLLTKDIDCMFICMPNNPTGQLIDRELLSEIVKIAETLDIKIMLDESFMDFAGEHHSRRDLMVNYPNISLLYSLTKFYSMPGIRLGYLVSSDLGLVKQMKMRQRPWSINVFASIAGQYLFDDQEYHTNTLVWLADEQHYLFEALKRFSQLKVWSPSANYIFFKVNSLGIDLQTELLNHNILIRSCANYIGLDTQFYRVAIKSHQDNERLIECLSKVFHLG